MTNMSLNRRTLLTGAVALGTVGLLAACGGNKKNETNSALGAGDDISKAVSFNPKDRSELKEGGELRLAFEGIPKNFNPFNTNGYTSGAIAIQAAMNSAYAGGYKYDYTGKPSLNTDYITEYKAETKNGVQTVTFKINPKAKFNDGTPIDIESVRAAHRIFTAPAGEYQVTDAPMWKQVKSVEENGDKFSVKVTMEKPYYPIDGGFVISTFIHPALVDKKLFNDGLVDKPLDKYWAGPFKVENWDVSQNSLILTRNDKWWGQKPLLEKISIRSLGEAASLAAFKNSEIDVISASSHNVYADVSKMSNIDIRKGTALGVSDYELNPDKIPLPVRKAIVAGINREQIQKIRFEKIGWNEKAPGSMCFLPLQEGYKDSYPTEIGEDVAKKILEDAGYKKDGDFYAKDGKKASYELFTFGDDQDVKTTSQFFSDQMKKIGIELKIVNRANSELTKVSTERSYGIKSAGYGITTNPVDSAYYFYRSEINNGHGKELDSLADKMMATEDYKKQLEIATELEKRHLAEVAIYIPVSNGPNYQACKKGLANYGPRLFATSAYDPDVWINAGWEK
ncbi:ABC transporter family substrate-binding protein [Rothia aeria]|jgi:extracellular solute-binding protein, family 5|uniref:ABC transporter family substrate-binding protein n=1 Tax=Rothia aeria TaxID=172042 RepID=UPI001917D5DD|nr:ABC transporter family substrate-binding protein [Rothia aeria]MDK7677410.1 ABC transporter family substrate-binding protein [Rothia aeria]QQT89892.1 ABC transporter family substrate-binding protein [Rothia aeria]